jgi:hypothetical protein
MFKETLLLDTSILVILSNILKEYAYQIKLQLLTNVNNIMKKLIFMLSMAEN